jgi:hypothetical protein
MTSREPSNSVVHRLVAAINDGETVRFLSSPRRILLGRSALT